MKTENRKRVIIPLSDIMKKFKLPKDKYFARVGRNGSYKIEEDSLIIDYEVVISD